MTDVLAEGADGDSVYPDPWSISRFLRESIRRFRFCRIFRGRVPYTGIQSTPYRDRVTHL